MADAGDPIAVERQSYDGRELPVNESEITRAEITTRDIDRAGYPHYLLKEISESPRSFRSTLLGKLIDTKAPDVTIITDATHSPRAMR